MIVSAQHVGAELKEARLRSGMTQVTLSALMGREGLPMHQTAISRVESGERELDYREALLLRALIGFGVEHANLQTFREAAAFRKIRAAVDEAVA